MKIRTIAMALAVAGMPSLVAAQQGTPPAQGQHGQHHRGEGQMRGQRGGGLQGLIARRQQLNLSDAQVQRLTAIQQRMQSQNQALAERLRAQRRQAGLPEMGRAQGQGGRDAQRGERRGRGARAQRPQLTEQQREALRRFREQSEPTRRQIMQNRQAAIRDAQAVLTEQQRQQVQQWMSRRGQRGGRDGHHGRRGRGRGQHEQHQGQGTSHS